MKRMLMFAIVILAGCELAETVPAPETQAAATTQSTDTTQPDTVSTASVTQDQAEWDAIAWKGPQAKGATQVMTLGARIDSSGSRVSFTFDTYPWSNAGLAHFFVWDGTTWRGGKFDWIRTGGQSIKSLENVHGGYNGLSAPASGTPCAFAWTSADGKTRSNLSKTVWP